MATDLLLRIGSDIKGFTDGIGDISGSIEKATSEIEGKFGFLDGLSDKIGGLWGGLALGAGAAAVGVGGALLTIGSDFDGMSDKIRVGTGATGEALASLGNSAKNVFAGVPSSLEQVSTAISELNTRTGLTGPSLEALATQTLNLARITGEQLEPLIASSTRAFGDWGIETDKQAGAMDQLYKVSQSTGIGVSTLAEKVVQFGAPLRQMGFDFETSTALLGKFEKEGVNSELVLGSLRIALTKMAKEGITDASAGLQKIIEDIKGAGSAGEANAIALDKFGARAGPDMAAAIREGRLEVGALMADLKNSPETINQAAKDTADLAEAFTTFKNSVMVAVEPLASGLFNALNEYAIPALQATGTAIKEVIDWFTNWDLSSWTQTHFGPFLNALEPVTSGLQNVWSAVGPLVSAFGEFAAKIAILGIGLLAEHFRQLWVAIEPIASVVGKAVSAFAGWALNQFAQFVRDTTTAFQALIGVLNKIPGVSDVFDEMRVNLAKVGATAKETTEETNKHGDAVKKAGDAHKDAAPHIGTHTDKNKESKEAAKQAAEEQRNLEAALSALGVTADGGVPKTEKMWQALRTLESAAKDGKIPLSTLEEASRKLHEELAKADLKTYSDSLKLIGIDAGGPGGAQEKIAKMEEALALVKREVELGIRPIEDLKTATANYKAEVEKLYPSIYSLAGAFKDMVSEVNAAKAPLDLLGTTTSATRDYMAGVAMATNDAAQAAVDAAEPAATLEKAYKTLGVTTSGALADKAKAAREAYATIVESGTASASDIRRAYEAMVTANKAAVGTLATDTKTTFGIISDLASGLSQSLAAGLSGLFGGVDSTQVKEQQRALESRTADFEKYADGIAKQLEGLTAKHQEQADKQIAAEEKSLGKKQTAFDKYQAGILDQLGGLDAKYEAVANKQIASLTKGLTKAIEDYEDYVEDAGNALEKITTKHQQELEKQERDAQRSLSAKLRDLEDYQRDAATKLARVGEDLDAKNRKEEQDYRDSLARKALDLDQYRATVQLKLDALAGDNSRNATQQREALLLSLQQREQDFLLWKNQAAAHLEAVTTANTTQANRQRTDIQTSLNDRQADFNQYKLDTEAKILELSAAHAAKAEEERAAIQAKLQERTADFEQYKLDVQTKIEEAKQTAITKAQEERDALLAKLNEKKADFDTYKAEMAAKVEEIKQAAITKAQEEREALQAKLKDKTADFEQYKLDVNAKIEEIRRENATKTGQMGEAWGKFTKDAGGAVSGMASGILDKLFRKGTGSVAEQNEVVVPGMKGPWSELATAVGGTMGSLATSIGNKLFTGEGSWVEIGKAALVSLAGAFAQMAVKWVTEATGLASQLSTIFSSIKVPSISIPGLGGGSTGGGGATAGPVDTGGIQSAVSSGITGIVTAATSAVSAISGIIGNFQFSGMNKSLDVIVQHTLGTKNELENLRRDEWTRDASAMTKWDEIWNAILGINAWDAPVIQKLDSIWNAILDLGGVAGGGGGVGTAALQSIETSAIGTNDHLAAFRTEVSTGFYNVAVQGDSVIGELRTIAGNTEPTPSGAMSVVAPNVEEGLRNINLSTQGVFNGLAPLKDIRDTLGAMRNNIGVVLGIKEAIVGQLGLIYKSMEEVVGSNLKEIARNTYQPYLFYTELNRALIPATSPAGGSRGAANISITYQAGSGSATSEDAEFRRFADFLARELRRSGV